MIDLIVAILVGIAIGRMYQAIKTEDQRYEGWFRPEQGARVNRQLDAQFARDGAEVFLR